MVIKYQSATQYKTKIKNQGTKKVSNMTVQITSSGGVKIQSVPGCKNNNGKWLCTIDTLRADKAVHYKYTVNVKSSGTLTSTLKDVSGNVLLVVSEAVA